MHYLLLVLCVLYVSACADQADPAVPLQDENFVLDAGIQDLSSDAHTGSGPMRDMTSDPMPDVGDFSRSEMDLLEDPTVLPICQVTLEEAFGRARMQHPGRDSLGYEVPAWAAVETFESALRDLLAGGYEAARADLEAVEYLVCRAAGDVILIEPLRRGTGHAVLAMRLFEEQAAPLILQAPHPIFDQDTLEQTFVLFEATRARVILASGTHRCATNITGCSGTSTVCNPQTRVYPESDMAHSVQSFFHAAHIAVAEHFTDDIVISVHGMARQGVSISNGTRREVAADSPVARLVDAMNAAGVENITSCNPGTSAPVENHLCGGTNTQGRHLNGSPDACMTSASQASERFIHLEQERALRSDPGRMSSALTTFVANL